MGYTCLGGRHRGWERHRTGLVVPRHLISKKPLYLSVRDVLVQHISSGAWKPGSAIPNESDLAREMGVSPGTVRRALQVMEADRLVTRRQGRGTFVKDHTRDAPTDRFSNLCTADGESASGKVVSVEIKTATANELECARLGLHADDTVYRIHRVRQHRDRVFLVEDITLPAALFPGLAASKAIADSIGVLAQEYGVLLGKVEERISMRIPPTAVADTLLVAPDTPVMVLDRVVLMLDGRRPVEWRLAHCHLADAYYLAAVT